MSLIQIDAGGGFCAAVQIEYDKVIEAAPLLRYMKGWTKEQVLAYAKRRGWRIIK